MTSQMKFLELSKLYDNDSGEQYNLYRNYINSHVSNKKILSFVNNYNLHDSVLVSTRCDSGKVISIDLINGDLESGYRNITITYKNASINEDTSLDILNKNKQHPIEVIVDEIDIENGVHYHRLLLSNNNIFSIEFDDMEVIDNGPGDRMAEFLKYK